MKPGKRIDKKRRRVLDSLPTSEKATPETFGELKWQYGQDDDGMFVGLAVTMPSPKLDRRLK
tara:strand:+ start:23993 stop:24178 length:186 start_codon:yes stop_codon:yes gene_type:complete